MRENAKGANTRKVKENAKNKKNSKKLLMCLDIGSIGSIGSPNCSFFGWLICPFVLKIELTNFLHRKKAVVKKPNVKP